MQKTYLMLLYCGLRQKTEDVAASLEKIFEPAGELEVEKTLRVMKNQKGLLYHQLGIKDFQTGIKVITLIKQF